MARSWDEILHDPRIDDEGNHDYYAEDLPSDTARWERGRCRCESCGKYRRLTYRSTHYFYCYDGWDSMSYTECWRCASKAKVRSIKWVIKNKIKKANKRSKTTKW